MPARRPLPLPSAPALTLNRSEWLYAACDGPMAQLNQAYILRFDDPVTADEVRAACRRLISAYPRLRGVMEATPRRFQLRILPEDAQLEDLFNLAFRVEHIDLDDLAAVRRWHELSLNDPMAMQRGLGVRMQFVPHPTRPAMIWNVHHLLADGRSMVMCVEALMKLLNGQAIADVPVDNPSMLPAVLPARWWQIPAKLLAAHRAQKAEQRERARYEIVRLPSKRSARYLSTGVQHHELGCLSKDLSKAAKARGGSGNSMLMAAMGTALLEMAGNRPGTAALVRVSVDLRRYFPEGTAPTMGNYVATLDILLPQEVPDTERVRWIDTRMREGMERFTQRTMILPLLPYEWLGGIRTHDYSRLIMRAKRLDALPHLSCHTTNIGSADAFNPPGARVRLSELYPTVSGVAPLMVFVSVNGRQVMVCSHQRDEYEDRDMQALITGAQSVLNRWMAAQPVPEPSSAPA
ncbi:MAG TPA: hypothetical protein H9903_19415 [Candidatus Aquabacterium excrementipullorum]|nr:hypothetical protein [Candidatus Aquabacterium excrementipullorum]